MAHATEADLANWLASSDFTPPTGAKAQHLLNRATGLVNAKVVAYYPTDEAGVPTETYVKDALRDATCAQVEQWLSVGEDNDYDGYPADTSVAANGTAVSDRPARLAPRARDLLRDAGLMMTRAW